MAAIQDQPEPKIEPAPVPPIIEPVDPVPDHDDPPPETINLSQEDEDQQAQSFADASFYGENDFGLSDTVKVTSGDEADDVQDLVDHTNDMVASGRIDMGAFRGERSDDDEEEDSGLEPD